MEKVREILAKGSLNGEEINFLMSQKHLLTQSDLVRLGLAPATPNLAVEEPVKVVPEAPKETETPPVATPAQRTAPKKTVRARKITK